MDFIAGAEPVKKEVPPLAALIAEVSGPSPAPAPPAPPPAEEPRRTMSSPTPEKTVQGRLQMPLPEPRPVAGTNEARPATDRAAPVPPPPAPATPPQPGPDKTILQLVERLDAAMEDAQQAFQSRRGYIAAESDAFGFRVLARMARCVERAAKANDMNALKDLLPELAVAVERNRIALTPRK